MQWRWDMDRFETCTIFDNEGNYLLPLPIFLLLSYYFKHFVENLCHIILDTNRYFDICIICNSFTMLIILQPYNWLTRRLGPQKLDEYHWEISTNPKRLLYVVFLMFM